MKKVLTVIGLFALGLLTSEISHHFFQDRLKIEKGDAALTMGKTDYPSEYGFEDSIYLVMDKENFENDATLVLREAGNARAEIGLVGDNDIHFKTVTGTYGNEIFVDRFLIRASGEVDSLGKIFRQYASSGTPRLVIGNSNGQSAGSGLELSYNFEEEVSGISSITRDISYRPLSFSAESYAFHTGEVNVLRDPAVQLLSEGTLKVFHGLQIASNGTFSGGAFAEGSLYLDSENGLVISALEGTENDFLLTTARGDNVFRVPEGTNNLEFFGNTKTLGVASLGVFTRASLPEPLLGGIIYVSNGAGGLPVLAFSDGQGWFRSDTRAPL